MSSSLVLADKVPPALAEKLANDYQLYFYTKSSPEEIQAISEQTEIIVASGESTVNAEMISRFPNLKLIAVFGVGYDGIDVATATSKNIQVTNTPDILTDDVADLGFALILNASRRINAAQRFIEQGNWASGSFPLASKVTGKRLGIVGYGRIGQAVADRARGFSMPVACFSRHPVTDQDVKWYGDLTELAHNSDILVVCVSANPQTRGLINKQVLTALGPKGILINISRGSVVDEAALVDAITRGEIGGAGLDVFAAEPSVPEALLNRPEVVLTPHIASGTHETRADMAKLVIDNITAFQNGQPLLTPVTPKA
ncbi:2-hydroxyacid dehydrogenase [Tatumella citrea]|uniref:Hydroxyacid dehydrogenase n=1 Tax=Tatumella citrea TaxID=53336 RepID=A0A1Y0LMH8_TATCI|nr:2-hydroxyacid dehydrogenase [Tatumella citrea]ARU94781.1 hypothetical protein A7K98_14045 [Tatumella citrea]ARU98819.1 hypothetical protein A7K99_14030 [Tatumella citrea]